MWKKNDAPIPQNAPAPPPAPAAQPAPVAAAAPAIAPDRPVRVASSPVSTVNIGAPVVIKGAVSAREDLTISGRIEGEGEVRDHVVRVGREAQVHAEISAR